MVRGVNQTKGQSVVKKEILKYTGDQAPETPSVWLFMFE